MRAGVTIVDSIHILSQQVESKPLRKALSEIAEELRKGNSLSDSLAKYPKIFEPLTINLVKAGRCRGISMIRLRVWQRITTKPTRQSKSRFGHVLSGRRRRPGDRRRHIPVVFDRSDVCGYV